jgi:hypothetical protein
MINAIKARALVCVCLIHVGLILSLIGLSREGVSQLGGWTLGFMLAGTLVMYGGFLLAALSVWAPMRPWIKRYQRAREWREWILHELPTVLALIPVLMTALKLLRSAWDELKAHQQSGDLGVKHLATVAQKFADQAEELGRDPSLERVKRKLRESGS